MLLTRTTAPATSASTTRALDPARRRPPTTRRTVRCTRTCRERSTPNPPTRTTGRSVATSGTPYRPNGLRLPVQRADPVQPARRRGRELEGLRTGPRQPRHRRERHAVTACGAPGANPTNGPVCPTRVGQRDRPVRAQALPPAVVPLDHRQPGRLQLRATLPTCSRPTNGLYHDLQRPRRRRRSAGSSPEQLLGRP